MEKKLVYNVTEFAKALRVSRQTVYNWIKEDKVKYNTLPNGEKRFPRSEVEKYTK